MKRLEYRGNEQLFRDLNKQYNCNVVIYTYEDKLVVVNQENILEHHPDIPEFALNKLKTKLRNFIFQNCLVGFYLQKKSKFSEGEIMKIWVTRRDILKGNSRFLLEAGKVKIFATL